MRKFLYAAIFINDPSIFCFDTFDIFRPNRISNSMEITRIEQKGYNSKGI